MITGIRCASCIWLIEQSVQKIYGVETCRLNYATNQAFIIWTPEKTSLEIILKRIQQHGYTPLPTESQEASRQETRDLLIRFGTSSFLAMQLMIYSMALYAGYFQGMDATMHFILQIAAGLVATPAVFFGGYPFFKGALSSLKSFHFSMDFLIAMGVSAAYGLSVYQTFQGGEIYYDTAVMIVTLILLGRLLEHTAKKRALDTVSGLSALMPDQARLLQKEKNGDKEIMVIVKNISTGDTIIVLPGERIPLDGIVLEGKSETDESMLTGESLPVLKTCGTKVLGGTINLNGRLLFTVSHTDKDTVLCRIIRAVEDAQARKAPVQDFADKVVSFFVPGVLFLAAGSFFWTLSNNSLEEAVIRSISVLIVACPCALGLATPLAILVGTGMAAKHGILFKGGDILELAGKVNHVVLDKTGTLTTGQMSVTNIQSHHQDWSKEKCRLYAASLEGNSEHFIGKAIRSMEIKNNLLRVDHFKIYPGQGIEGIIKQQKYIIGNEHFLRQNKIQIPKQSLEKNKNSPTDTKVFLAAAGVLLADFSLTDRLRQEATSMVKKLLNAGMSVSLVSGDHKNSVQAAASAAGITRYLYETMPDQKVEYIEKCRAEKTIVAMIGDGINDAPALTAADVGIAVAKGADIAIGSADIVFIRDDLNLVPKSFLFAKKIFITIQQNLFWAFGYNIIVLPAAFFGLLHPIFSAAAMALSSLCVVGNSLRLQKIDLRES